MPPKVPLPLNPEFDEAEAYVESLLPFITTSSIFQKLCGGVHILDFFTKEPDLYTTALPSEWRDWFKLHDMSAILDLFMRENLTVIESLLQSKKIKSAEKQYPGAPWRKSPCPPISLLEYIQDIRKHALNRSFGLGSQIAGGSPPVKSDPLPPQVAVGMKPKKIHEVENFVKYISNLVADIQLSSPYQITHVVDFGSGQNYLGRALASPPHNRQVVALESKPLNISGAKSMDVKANLVEKEKTMRNKKQYRVSLTDVKDKTSASVPATSVSIDACQAAKKNKIQASTEDANALGGKGPIQYIESFIQDGDLSSVHKGIVRKSHIHDSNYELEPLLMVISLHSCGNLLHHGLRSLIINPFVKAVAMVGCCYNLVTERLGPPTYKLPSLRSSNPRLHATSAACDPHGFPMSERLATYQHQYGKGIRLNITARMMAVQAPENWTATDCESFFTRHFYRALLQRIFLDRGIVGKPTEDNGPTGAESPRGWTGGGLAITIGSLRKSCYSSFVAYVRGAVAKLSGDQERGSDIVSRMEALTDDDIACYEEEFKDRKKELSIIWSLMAFSASVVESVIVVDRWIYLKEQAGVKDCWVEAVFEYKQSPRNLVVVGIKE